MLLFPFLMKLKDLYSITINSANVPKTENNIQISTALHVLCPKSERHREDSSAEHKKQQKLHIGQSMNFPQEITNPDGQEIAPGGTDSKKEEEPLDRQYSEQDGLKAVDDGNDKDRERACRSRLQRRQPEHPEQRNQENPAAQTKATENPSRKPVTNDLLLVLLNEVLLLE